MTLPEALQKSPRLALYLEEIKALLECERIARERYYSDTPDDIKAEFINGRVVRSPPNTYEHIGCQQLSSRLLSAFVQKHQLGFVGTDKATLHLTRNDYEPDIAFWRSEVSAGFTPGQVRFPVADLVVEVLSKSTARRDRGIKMDDYAAHGVREYWLIDPERRELEQYLLRGDVFELAMKAADGELRARSVAGFTVPIAALFDAEVNLAVLKGILLD